MRVTSQVLTENRTEHRTKERILPIVRVFLLAVLQVTIVPRLGLFSSVPDILLPYLVVRAVTDHRPNVWRELAVSGMVIGFLSDTLGGVGLGVLSLFYFLCGAFLPHLSRARFAGVLSELLGFYATLLPVSVLRAGVTLLYSLQMGFASFSFGYCALHVLLPEWLGTLLLGIPVFFLFRVKRKTEI